MTNELPSECDICGEEEDPIGISDRVRIIGTCRECGAACCEACMPAGVGTVCVECEENHDDDEE